MFYLEPELNFIYVNEQDVIVTSQDDKAGIAGDLPEDEFEI